MLPTSSIHSLSKLSFYKIDWALYNQTSSNWDSENSKYGGFLAKYLRLEHDCPYKLQILLGKNLFHLSYHNYEICVLLVHVGPKNGCLPVDGKVTIICFLFLGEGFVNTSALFTVYLLICIEISLSETGIYFMLTFHYRQSEDGKRMLQNQTENSKLIKCMYIMWIVRQNMTRT